MFHLLQLHRIINVRIEEHNQYLRKFYAKISRAPWEINKGIRVYLKGGGGTQVTFANVLHQSDVSGYMRVLP